MTNSLLALLFAGYALLALVFSNPSDNAFLRSLNEERVSDIGLRYRIQR